MCIYFFNNRYFLLASLVGFEPARQRYIASQKPNTIPTDSDSTKNHAETTRYLWDREVLDPIDTR